MNALNNQYVRNNGDLGFNKEVLDYPEKVIQFGTGVLLRGLPDLIIDQANKQGKFCGRIAMVKSTDRGSVDSFVDQDCLYTVGVRGIENGVVVDKKEICTSVSRVLVAKDDWQSILEIAESDNLEVVVSNTTEVGISFTYEILKEGECPESFPGKLLAILKHRFDFFLGDDTKGLVILPTELISENGRKLKAIVRELAEVNEMDQEFIIWVEEANVFCNTLVDRIVPGALKGREAEQFNKSLHYQDANSIIAEPYALWAIEGNESVKDKLTFCTPESGAFVEENIEKYKEIKLRLLNASHTFSSGLAYLLGFNLVKESMNDGTFLNYLQGLMMEEINFAMGQNIPAEEKKAFAFKVVDRFSNPFLEHQWLSICMNYSSKMAMRCLPLISSYYKFKRELPALMLFGFAAHLYFLKPVKSKDGQFFGSYAGKEYPINDPNAAFFQKIWQESSSFQEKVKKIAENSELWGENLNNLDSFVPTVAGILEAFEADGVKATMSKTLLKEPEIT